MLAVLCVELEALADDALAVLDSACSRLHILEVLQNIECNSMSEWNCFNVFGFVSSYVE